MTTSAAQGRPRTHGDGPEHHTHMTPATTDTPLTTDARVPATPDVTDLMERTARLVRLVEDQRRAESCAWADGWSAGYARGQLDANPAPGDLPGVA